MSNDNIQRRGLMLVLSSPSGAGKTTLSRKLLESDVSLTMSISATTRSPRSGEAEGKDYFFVSPSMFTQMVEGEAFLEHALVFGHHYGTPKEPVMLALAKGRDVLFDIDWQGTQQLRQRAGDDLVSIFVLPPRKMWSRPVWPRPTTKSATGRNMIMSSSTTISSPRCRKSVPSWMPSA
jgi:guanylate kinase